MENGPINHPRKIAALWGRVGVGGGRYETCLAGVSEARSPPTLALAHKGGGDHKAFCTSVFLLIQRNWGVNPGIDASGLNLQEVIA